MSHVPLRAKIGDFTPDEQAALKQWWGTGGVLTRVADVEADSKQKFGLWVMGVRQHGSSYLSECAMAKLTRAWPMLDWEHVYALALVDLIKYHWSQQEMTRRNPDDYELFLEYQDSERKLDRIWYDCDAVWIDDFHADTVDVKFWRKHVQPYIERRVKDRKPTIVTTTLLPDDLRLSGLEQVIMNLFVICRAELPVSERNGDAER